MSYFNDESVFEMAGKPV